MCVNLERFLRKVVHISISPLSIALNLSNLFNRFLDTQFYRKIFALSSFFPVSAKKGIIDCDHSGVANISYNCHCEYSRRAVPPA